MSLHIAVFAKAPVAGLTKTRLIPLLGPNGAADAHRQMTELALRSALHAAPGQVSLWSAGAPDHPVLIDCCQRFGIAAYPQAEGDLGQRMAVCFSRLLLDHQRVLLIGSDCPVLASTDLQLAARALEQGARLVFTPAEDGGYVLVGATRDGAAGFTAIFDAMIWSTDRVMTQTRSRLRALGWQHGPDWAEMPERWDVDEPADYLRAVQLGLLPD
ncbi:TIGR04282 family arsenosugar biosynthesis glycosyltransferase [Actimicrobium sp. CCI2.3]|uniref:TIGR04282 family arsenosugar biosynthesis glycosyltransferase n=1 Tax=Actimicrobium sp. CCI2.3 TaxID=3048616 RepID=UPI002AB5427B|nr:TIGR04282 family arsenosugar biosynthesis glycosyltransferase [Actimicrobium sp. CCI2.3]MDY7575815.1 TIGR04282 family arsenosugar biosynthesis glycosyltransferase [Actimicrobium sp. CCI2.3]MEB0021628.1 TIGR04282 family arsenosugar biosynthesis glycosyltransferase [Actimicrobium sp. CCI2.3]